MPEGNTVWLTARTLRRALAGDPLTTADLRVADYATADLTRRRVIDVLPRGKHLLMRIEGGVTLHTHLRMDGAWRLYPAGRTVGDARDDVRVVLATSSTTAVGYRLHDVVLLPTADENSLVGHLGPDLLGPNWNAAEAARRLAAQARRPIGEALLDQRNLAGAGNVYKAESCFLRGISPWTPVAEVPDLGALVAVIHRLLSANRERYRHVTTGDPRPGHQLWVFDRAGRPCRRCGAAVQAAWQGDPPYRRLSYWCRSCQPGPAPQPAAPAAQDRPVRPGRRSGRALRR
jgi:endonuclease VIII